MIDLWVMGVSPYSGGCQVGATHAPMALIGIERWFLAKSNFVPLSQGHLAMPGDSTGIYWMVPTDDAKYPTMHSHAFRNT